MSRGSFLKWMGGKARGAKDIISSVGNPIYTEWREPFAGSAGMFFSKWIQPRHVWLNDVDADLVKVYQSLIDGTVIEDAQREFPYFRGVEHVHARFAAACCRIQARTHTAWDYVLVKQLAKCQLVGRMRKTIASFAYNYVARFMNMDFVGRLRDCRARLLQCGARVTLGDFADVIRAPGDRVLVFCDPPYLLRCSDIYEHALHEDGHYRLAWELRRCKHRFILTIGPSDDEKKIYLRGTKWAKVIDRDFTRTDADHAPGKELLICNF